MSNDNETTKVTVEMVALAVKQLVADGILPKYASMDTYIHHYESVERALNKALEGE